MLGKICRESGEENRVAYQIWKTQQYEFVMRENRFTREKMYVDKRKDSVTIALDRDAKIGECLNASQDSEIAKEMETYTILDRARQARRQAQVTDFAEGLVQQVVDISFAAAMERKDTNRDVDGKKWRDWMNVFTQKLIPVRGSSDKILPLTATPPPPIDAHVGDADTQNFNDNVTILGDLSPRTSCKATANVAKQLVAQDDAALHSYLDLSGEWKVDEFDAEKVVEEIVTQAGQPAELVESLDKQIVLVDNKVKNVDLGQIVSSLLDYKFALPEDVPPPQIPNVPLRIAISGKPFSGKNALAERLGERYNLEIINIDALIRECVHGKLMQLSPEGDSIQAEPEHPTLDAIGQQIHEFLKKGEAITDELYVAAIIAKLRILFPNDEPSNILAQADEEAEAAEAQAAEDEGFHNQTKPKYQPFGWVLCGFPWNIEQAALLEKSLSGYVIPEHRPVPELKTRKDFTSKLLHWDASNEPVESHPGEGAIDLFFNMEVRNSEIVRRSVGKYVDPHTRLVYHLQDSPPQTKNTIVYEYLEPHTEPCKTSRGVLIDRLHVYDTQQPELCDFVNHFAPMDGMQRGHQVPEGTIEKTWERVLQTMEPVVARKMELWEAMKISEAEIEAAREAEDKYDDEEAGGDEEEGLTH